MSVCDPELFGKSSVHCHMCGSEEFSLVLDLGMHPHSDDFLNEKRLTEVEHTYPLRLVSCGSCGLLQIDYFVNPAILYQTNYVYESSITEKGVRHYKDMAASLAKAFNFKPGSLSVDIGSNVGVLLVGFKKYGFTVLGVDPAENIAKQATENGIETIIDFFSEKVAQSIIKEKGKAKVVTGTNVFAHLHDIDSAVSGMALLLDADGVLVIEAPYALDMLKFVEYDTIYHQHIGYLSVRPMKQYFEKFNLELFNVEHQNIHGGTLRYFVGHKGVYSVSSAVDEALRAEDKFGLYDTRRLQRFAADVYRQRNSLRSLLDGIKNEGMRIAGISAPAKGNTLLNFCGIDSYYLDFITEKSNYKRGLYTPGTHISIYSDDILLKEQPDYALILAWNFAEEIKKNLSEYANRGGKFIIPIPLPHVEC